VIFMLLLERLVVRAERHLFRWRPQETSA